MKRIFILMTGLGIGATSLAQSLTNKVTGVIKDGGDRNVIQSAVVSLLKANDSSWVKTVFTDSAGNFSFDHLSPGKYLVAATSVGHLMVYSQPFSIQTENDQLSVGELKLIPKQGNLKEVVVTTKKQLIERKLDRTIVNVDAAITNAGSTAMDILEKSPGVTADKDGNLSLKGKQGVLILLDGKPAYLDGAALANLLRSMPASGLDQIEIMTNPSAKYDAAGNSGIINIKTKKNKMKGFNGTLNLGEGQGIYARTNGSINLNYRTGKFNLFTNINANYEDNYHSLDIVRKYRNPDGSIKAIFEQNSMEIHHNTNYSAKLGADFYAAQHTTFGIVLSGFSLPQHQTGTNTSYLKSNVGIVDSIVASTSVEDDQWKNGSVNLNFRHQFDSTGKELTADIDYVKYNEGKDQQFGNINYTPNWALKSSDQLLGDLPTTISICSAKMDYTHPFKSGLKMETGIKSSFVKTDNIAGYYNLIGGIKQTDYDKTNHFVYHENINAAYINLSKEFKKWSFQAGLRLENTNYRGNQFGNPTKQDSAFNHSYTGLFPTLYVGYKANDKNEFSFSFGRRIDRPNYEDLNPFLFFMDKYTYGAGNPFLQPSYSQTLEISHTYRQFLTTTLNYSHTKDLFSDIFIQKGYATEVQKGNFGYSNHLSLSVSAQIPANKWWTLIPYTEFQHGEYNGLLNGEIVNVQGNTFLVNLTNQFKFNKGWSAELSGFYRTKGVEGQIIINPIGELNAGVQKQVLKNKGTLKLNISDILLTRHEVGNINFQQTEAYFNQHQDSRVANLTFIYRFGKPIKGPSQRNSGGAGDEKSRVKQGGN